ncbi:hypothetical protein [Rhodanobacter sp. L36]|uniref:hypothetical protein n=1 Tax=Rhodanobacter sp. L36 TaxID=1747221 RepID=UPI00131B7D79|nr:hypothetical protein [Rhodanobacter sp. L36]
MKLRALSVTLALSLASASITPPAHAQLPPDVLVCMAGISGFGTTGGPACIPSVAEFYDIAVYDEMGFDPFATAIARTVFLYMDPGAPANAAVVEAVVYEHFGEP